MSSRVFALTSYAHFSNDGSTFLYPLLISFLHGEFPLVNVGYLGIIAIINPIISGLMSTPVGILADIIERKGFLISLGLAISGVAALIFAYTIVDGAISYFNIIAGVTVLGFGQAFYHPIGASILRGEYGSRTPTLLGINGSFGSFGRGIYILIITTLITVFGLVYGLTYLSIIGFVASMVIAAGLGSPNIKISSKKSKSAADNRSDKRKEISKQMSFYKLFIFSLMTVVFLRAMFIRSVATYGPTYFTDLADSQFFGNLIFGIGLLTPVIGQPIFGLITTKKGGFFSISVTTLFSGLAFFLLLVSGAHLILVGLFFATYAFFTYSGFPILLGYLNQVVPREISTSSGGVIWGMGQLLGGAAGIAVSSVIVLYSNIYESYWIMMIFTLAATILLPLLGAQEKSIRKKSRAQAS